MKIIIYGATEIGCLLATEFFEDHDITIIDKEENNELMNLTSWISALFREMLLTLMF